jgi:hypothetical protein
MKKNARPGPKVKINGVEYDTVMIEKVQRFPENQVVRRLLDEATNRGYNLNHLWETIEYNKSRSSSGSRDMRAFYRMIGISVCGYSEVFENDEIDNPLWRK